MIRPLVLSAVAACFQESGSQSVSLSRLFSPHSIPVMFSTSSQLKHWMYGSVDEVCRLRDVANKDFIRKHKKLRNMSETAFLSSEEERMLLIWYQNTLKDFCRSFQPPMPRPVIVSCLTIFFYDLLADILFSPTNDRPLRSSTTSDFTSTIQ